MFTIDSNGRISASSGTIVSHVAGLPFDADGALVISDGTLTPAYFQNGWPFDSSGAVAVHVSGSISNYQNGLPFTSVGRLVTDSSNTIVNYLAGLPYAASGLSVGGAASYVPALKFNDARNSQYWMFFI